MLAKHQNCTPKRGHLSAEHERMLAVESAITPEVIAAREYRTIADRADVPQMFAEYQRRRGLLIPMCSPDGISIAYQLRPDKPRYRDGKHIKYETPGGVRCIIDIHPSMHDQARDVSAELWVTEGIKKGDALTSRGCCTVSLVGVWNWQRKGEPVPCWDHVALEGREVYVVFDSDVMVKEGVQLALERFVAFLEERGALVRVVYLPEPSDE